MDPVVLAIFVLVYAGMILGELPGLALDRSGIALLGAIALLATGRLTLEDAWLAMDAHTLALLFGLMVVSAQFRLGGFYTETVRRLAAHAPRPEALLLWVVVAAGALSSVLANDIVCLAMAPVLIEVCARRQITPVPLLLALACASNAGLGGDIDRQPAEHVDRRVAAAVICRIPARWRTAGSARSRGDVAGHPRAVA